MITIARQLASIARITMIEGARKHIFHVLMLFALTLIAISTALGIFDHNIQIKVVKDLCLISILLSSGIIAITLSVSGLPQEIELKTVYPVMAKPIKRWQFVFGKYLGTMGTVTIGMLIMGVAFIGILMSFGGHLDAGVFLVMPYLWLEAAILAAVSVFLSTVCAPALAWFLSIIIYSIGNMKYGLYSFLTAHDHSAIGRFIVGILYQSLPNLECFNFKDSIVYGISVPSIYLIQTAVYGCLYTAALLTSASIIFGKREL